MSLAIIAARGEQHDPGVLYFEAMTPKVKTGLDEWFDGFVQGLEGVWGDVVVFGTYKGVWYDNGFADADTLVEWAIRDTYAPPGVGKKVLLIEVVKEVEERFARHKPPYAIFAWPLDERGNRREDW